MRLSSIIVINILFLVGLFLPTFTLGQKKDKSLTYQKRGNRSEGFYAAKVAAPSLDIVGFTKGILYYNLYEENTIKVSTYKVNKKKLTIHAQAIPLKTYYRMDSKIPQGDTLKWPTVDVLVKAQLPSSKIGVLGWFTQENSKTYLLLTVPTNPKIRNNHFIITLRSSTDVEDVRWRYATIKKHRAQKYTPWKSVHKKLHRAGKAIRIILPSQCKGELRIGTAARERNSGRWLQKEFNIIIK